MTTLAMKFKREAKRLVPYQTDLQRLDNTINSIEEIDVIMFRTSEYVGGMATVILELLKKGE